jgi:hypothetical protein
MRSARLTLAAILFTGCSDGVDDGGAVVPAIGTGKADALDHVEDRGPLSFGVARMGTFVEDLQFEGYRVTVRDGARVRLEITRLGTAAKLDTTLFVYGPFDGSEFGGEAIAFDDDSGWGRQSRLTGLTLEGGEYLVVVGTHDARGRGAYRVLATCESGECEPENECAFGEVFHDLRTSTDVVGGTRRVLTSPAGLTALEEQQVIRAVQSSAHEDVTTIDEAFERMDQNEINQIEIWDRTNARPFVVYEFGAGDTSVGAYFAHGTTERVAVISDGEIEDCAVSRGPQGGACTSTDECSVGECVGIAGGVGRCTVLTGFGEQSECSVDAPCDIAEGLICGGLTRSDEGICQPAWMSGNFADTFSSEEGGLSVPDGDDNGLVRTVLVNGLATVDTDVELDMFVIHPDATQLRITLTNPAGAEVTVFEGEASEVFWRRHPVLGFSGDEMVNGEWTLRIVDDVAGDEGTLDHWTLRLRSRFD